VHTDSEPSGDSPDSETPHPGDVFDGDVSAGDTAAGGATSRTPGADTDAADRTSGTAAGVAGPTPGMATGAADDRVDIAVVGGGASAVLLVAALRHHAGDAMPPVAMPSVAMPSVAIIDPAETVGLGVAYSTTSAHHRLNVRASGLSALVHDPDHFTRWLASADPTVPPHGFALRSQYGMYLRDVLAGFGGNNISHVRATVSAVKPNVIEHGHHGATVHLDDGGIINARRVVLAIGVPPTAAAHFAVADAVVAAGTYIADPWAPGVIDTLVARHASTTAPLRGDAAGHTPHDPQVASGGHDSPTGTRVAALVGTGLTSVDLALSLTDAGWDVVAVSPHGLLPERHELIPSPARATLADPPEVVTAASFIHWVRTTCINEPGGWRAAMDALRFRIDPVWQRTPLEHRQRLVTRVGSVWQRHRHRIAPDVAGAIDDLIVQGRLRIERGRVVGIAMDPDGQHLLVQREGPGRAPMDPAPMDPGDAPMDPAPTDPGGAAMDPVVVDAVVNCAGAPSIHATTSALTRTLLDDGILVADGLGMGVQVDPRGRAVGIDGNVSSVVTVVGALRRGVEAEAIAIPDLRVHADTAARRLLDELGAPATPGTSGAPATPRTPATPATSRASAIPAVPRETAALGETGTYGESDAPGEAPGPPPGA